MSYRKRLPGSHPRRVYIPARQRRPAGGRRAPMPAARLRGAAFPPAARPSAAADWHRVAVAPQHGVRRCRPAPAPRRIPARLRGAPVAARLRGAHSPARFPPVAARLRGAIPPRVPQVAARVRGAHSPPRSPWPSACAARIPLRVPPSGRPTAWRAFPARCPSGRPDWHRAASRRLRAPAPSRLTPAPPFVRIPLPACNLQTFLCDLCYG